MTESKTTEFKRLVDAITISLDSRESLADKTIVVCCSASFYQQAAEVQKALVVANLKVAVPSVVNVMVENDDFEVSHYKTWYDDASDYDKKAGYMRAHFDEITKGDIVLILNYEKHGKPNYIGPNVLMEMSLAWYQRKPIFLLNPIPEDSPFEEELKAMMPIVINN